MTNATEHDVASNLVRSDRRYRTAQLVSLAFVVVVVMVLFVLLRNEIHRDVNRLVEEAQTLSEDARRDDRIRAEETRRYVTCLLVIPIEQRTTERQRRCFEGSNTDGGLQEEDFRPSPQASASASRIPVREVAAPSMSRLIVSTSSSDSRSATLPAQLDNSQQPAPTTDGPAVQRSSPLQIVDIRPEPLIKLIKDLLQ